eukprot:m.23693 g.23693  ORF g.23693 m.23693 type:complete len:1587 (+) comp7533_c0_seq1:120-4880(+)
MPPKRGKSGKKSASATPGWDKELIQVAAKTDQWRCFVVVTVSNGEVSSEFLRKGASDASTGRRDVFISGGYDDISSWVKDAAKAKTKSKDPVDLVIQDACVQASDYGEKIPPKLYARLIKAKVIQRKIEDVKRREEKEAAARAGVGSAGKDKKPPKSAKGKKKGKGPADDGPGKKASTMVTRANEGPANAVNDDPEDGPDLYVYIQGVDSLDLIKGLDECGIAPDLVLTASASSDANENGQSQSAEYREGAQLFINGSSNGSDLRNIRWASVELGVKGAIEPNEVFDTVAKIAFETVSLREKYSSYYNAWHVNEIPSCPASLLEVDMSHYKKCLNSIPVREQTVPVIFDCLLEQVSLTVDSASKAKAENPIEESENTPGDSEQTPQDTTSNKETELAEATQSNIVATAILDDLLAPFESSKPVDVESKDNTSQCILHYGDSSSLVHLPKFNASSPSPLERAHRVNRASMGCYVSQFPELSENEDTERQVTYQQLCRFVQTSNDIPLDELGLQQLQFELMVGNMAGIDGRVDLSNWTLREGLHKNTLAQVLTQAMLDSHSEVYKTYDDLQDKILLAIGKKHTGFCHSKTDWSANVNTLPAFTNFLEHVLGNQENAKETGEENQNVYKVGDKLIRFTGSDFVCFPTSGGSVSISTTDSLGDTTRKTRKVEKDGNSLITHLKEDWTTQTTVVNLADGIRVVIPEGSIHPSASVKSNDISEDADTKVSGDEPDLAADKIAIVDEDSKLDNIDSSTPKPQLLVQNCLPNGVVMEFGLKGEIIFHQPDSEIDSKERRRCYFPEGHVLITTQEGREIIFGADGTISERGEEKTWSLTLPDGTRQVVIDNENETENDDNGSDEPTSCADTSGGVDPENNVEDAGESGTKNENTDEANENEDTNNTQKQDDLPMIVTHMHDSRLRCKATIREDKTTSVDFETHSVVEFEDGTRIITRPATQEIAASVTFECLHFPRVTMRQNGDGSRLCSLHLENGTRIEINDDNGRVVNYIQSNSTTLSIDENTQKLTLVCPPSDNFDKENFSSSFVCNLANAAFETADHRLTSFIGNECGEIQVIAENEEHQTQTANSPFPRLFVVNRDGSGTELLHKDSLKDFRKTVDNTTQSAWNCSESQVIDEENATCVTYLKHLKQISDFEVSYSDVNILPRQLRLKNSSFPLTKTTRHGPPTVCCRQIESRSPMSQESRAALLESLESFLKWRKDRTDNSAELLVSDTRSAEEKELAEQVSATLKSPPQTENDIKNTNKFGNSTTMDIMQDDDSLQTRFEKATEDIYLQNNPVKIYKVYNSFDEYFIGTPLEGNIRMLERQLGTDFVPKYWDSPEYSTFLTESENTVQPNDSGAETNTSEVASKQESNVELDSTEPEDTPQDHAGNEVSDSLDVQETTNEKVDDETEEGVEKESKKDNNKERDFVNDPQVQDKKEQPILKTTISTPMAPIPPINSVDNDTKPAPLPPSSTLARPYSSRRLNKNKPLPPINRPSSIHIHPSKLVFETKDTSAKQVLNIVNHGTTGIRIKLSQLPQGLEATPTPGLLAPGMKKSVTLSQTQGSGKQTHERTEVWVMTSVGSFTVPVQFIE